MYCDALIFVSQYNQRVMVWVTVIQLYYGQTNLPYSMAGQLQYIYIRLHNLWIFFGYPSFEVAF